MLDLRDTAAGSFGALCNVYSGLPFDVAKVRLQTQSALRQTANTVFYRGPIHCIYTVARRERLPALWKGGLPALGSATVENSLLFTANEGLKRSFGDKDDPHESRGLSLLQLAFVGGLAGVFSGTAITPFEMVKCTLQFQRNTDSSSRRFSGPIDVAVSAFKERGIRGLFRGLPATVGRDVPFNFFFFGSYETICSAVSKLSGVSSRAEFSPPLVMLCGGLAGATAWSVVFPMDVVKSWMQCSGQLPGVASQRGSQPAGVRDVISHVYRQGGIRAFYRGCSSAILRAFVANGALLMGVEMAQRVMRDDSLLSLD